MSCLQTIRSRYDSLTAAEKRIADYVLLHEAEVPGLSIREFAENARVAQSAIIRCCKSLGFEGYPQLKLALAADLSKNRQLNYAPYIFPEDSPAEIVEKVFSANVKALHDTADQLNQTQIEQILDRLAAARHICLYGVGTSASMVTELQYRLMQLGYDAFAYTDPVSMRISTLNLDKQDVALAISYSGRTEPTVQAMELAGEAGAETVCITGFPDSPLAKLCRCPVCVCSDEVRYPVEAMSAKIAQLSLIYALTTALSARHYEDTVQRAKKTRALIDSIRLEGSR